MLALALLVPTRGGSAPALGLAPRCADGSHRQPVGARLVVVTKTVKRSVVALALVVTLPVVAAGPMHGARGVEAGRSMVADLG